MINLLSIKIYIFQWKRVRLITHLLLLITIILKNLTKFNLYFKCLLSKYKIIFNQGLQATFMGLNKKLK